VRVGVADLPRYFPEIENTLARLNDVQDRFLFETVEIVAPLGVWEVKNGDKRAQTYLDAERFAKKLARKPRELGLDFLACVTNRRLRADDVYDIYGWWSADPDLQILVFSTAGLSLPPLGTAASRAIANQLVEGLAAQLLESAGGEAIHKKGPTTCPFYYNEDRDVAHVTGRLRFDAACRKKLLSKLPKEAAPEATVEAFDSLLAAFDDEGS
jgi:hypothetical protein